MRIAIAHHHLRPGGVTRVIENAVASCAGQGHEFVVLTGEPCPKGSPLASCSVEVEGLGYRADADGLTAAELAGRMRRAAGPADVWHLHNHSLGKNAVLADAVALLAGSGERMLLQIHDFAEDGRPSNYAVVKTSHHLYPADDGVHYAVLSGRDRGILTYAGVPEEHLHLLPNPVALPDLQETDNEGEALLNGRILFYPTRGIRRKNIGEVVFLAALSGSEGIRMATSRAPDNAAWQEIHSRWETFAEECALPVSLGVVDNPRHGGKSFDAWLRAARGILTTSIAEGFGLAFLEPLLAGKPLVGRDLPEVTTDFRNAGLKFPGLYRALLVPESWVDMDALRSRLGELLKRQFIAYGVALPKNAEDRALRTMMPRTGWIDFGCLEESFQEAIIRRVVDAPAAVGEVRVLADDGEIAATAPWLRKRIDMVGRVDAAAAAILEKHYSLASNGARLRACYKRVATAGGVAFSINREVILNVFLAPERFHLLRTD